MGIHHQLPQLSEVFSDGLRGMGKTSVGLHVDRRQLAPEQLEKDRHEHSASASDAVEGHSEFLLSDPIDVEKGERQNFLDVLPRRVLVLSHDSELVPGRSRYVSLHDLSHLRPFRGIEKQPGWTNELERVPLDRVVARGDGEAAGGLVALDGQLYRGGRNLSL